MQDSAALEMLAKRWADDGLWRPRVEHHERHKVIAYQYLDAKPEARGVRSDRDYEPVTTSH